MGAPRLVEKPHEGAKVTKKYARAATPYQQVRADTRISNQAKADLVHEYEHLNPAPIRRDLLAP